MARGVGSRRRKWAWASSALAAATTTVYVFALAMEGNNPFWDVFPWALLMLIGTSAAFSSAMAGGSPVGRSSAIAAAVVLGILGIVSIFSVGLGFILAAILGSLAAAKPAQPIAT